MIDTATVTDRRALKFNTPGELEADVARLVAADRAGTLRRTGNWTLGQTLGHLGSWAGYAHEGYPMHPPWFVRLFGRVFKKKMLANCSRAGFRIPRVAEGTYATEAVSTDEGLARFSRAWDRMKREAPSIPNPLFGTLTHQEWIRMHLGHAELHLSFLHP